MCGELMRLPRDDPAQSFGRLWNYQREVAMREFFVHEQGLCESEEIGPRTHIWAFAHVLAGAHIGADCNICDGVFIEDGVVIGDRVTIKCGVQIWKGVTIEHDVFIGPNATFTNDAFPRSRHHPAAFLPTLVKRGASIGANATVLPGVTIEENVMVGAGAVVLKDAAPGSVFRGPAAELSPVPSHRLKAI